MPGGGARPEGHGLCHIVPRHSGSLLYRPGPLPSVRGRRNAALRELAPGEFPKPSSASASPPVNGTVTVLLLRAGPARDGPVHTGRVGQRVVGARRGSRVVRVATATVMAVMMAVVVVTLLVMMHEALALCSGLSWAQGYPTSRTKVVPCPAGIQPQ